MKKLALFLGTLLLACTAFATSVMAKLPADMNEFQARFEKEATTPEGATKLWFEGAFLFNNPATRQLGHDILVAIMKGLPNDFERNAAHATMVERIKDQVHIMRSFCAGTSPENGYKADLDNCELTVVKSKEGMENTWVLSLKSSGADSERQVTLYKDGDHWKVWNCPGLYMGVRDPKM